MGKEVKTNAMRMLDRQKIPYELMNYECEEFVDGMDVADKLGQDYEMTFKTLVTLGKSGNYYVYAIPVHRELDMKKAARAVGEKHVEMVPVKEINKVTGYIRGGCTPIYVYVACAIGLFILFYPVLSGLAIDPAFATKYLKWFDSWVLLQTW